MEYILLGTRHSFWGANSRGREKTEMMNAMESASSEAMNPIIIDSARSRHRPIRSEQGVRLAQQMQVGPCIPVRIQL
jgi:hypothetical protein